jgi:IclR family pca regulon transcriptional regulator
MTISLSIGSRLPALWTSMGRVLLAGLPDDELDAFLAAADMHPPTNRGIADRAHLRAEIVGARSQGYALVDQELEEGIRSVAAPLRDRTGRVLAGMNVSTHAGRVTLKDLRSDIVPRLLDTTRQINAQLAKR